MKLPQFEYAALTMDIVPMTGATPYSIVGNWPVISLALILVGLFGWRSFEGRRASLRR